MAAVNGQNFYTDPLGRLVHSGAANRDFLYDIGSNQIILDRTGFGGPLNRAYVPGPGQNEPLMALNPGTGAIEHLHQDERGSVIAISDAAGNATAINRYDEYGVPQAGNSGRFQYTGQAWMPEVGLYYYHARMYNPGPVAGGRFMQVDPVGYEDQWNLYAYVGNDPLNFVDPSGTRCESSNGFTTCTPEDARFEAFSFPTPPGWEDFYPADAHFHSYSVNVNAGVGGEEYGRLLTDELVRHPTPGEGAAAVGGTLIDVNIPGPFGADHVRSDLRQDSSGRTFITNVTQEDHTLHSGFVVRQVVPNREGGYTIQTYGEGNSWKQRGPLTELARPTWLNNSRTIIDHARQRLRNR